MSVSAQRGTSWLVLVAFLFAILAPVAGQAMGREDVARTMLLQLCSKDGPQLVAVELPDDTASDAVPASDHGGFCLLCVCPATPPETTTAFFSPAVFSSVPIALLDDAAPRVASAWRLWLARAPPSDA